MPLLLFLLVLGVFLPALRCGFVNYDDPHNVYASPQITQGLTTKGIRSAFTHPVLGHWDPLTTISHMVDCQIYGVNPWGHHLTNVLLHGLSAALLFGVLRGMTGALWRSAFVATLFAIHPLRVESVVWITERKDVLSGVFFMLTLGAYMRYVRRRSLASYLTVALCLALGLMSKSMLVTLPCVLLLLDFWPLQRLSRLAILEKVPLFALSVASSLMQLHAVSGMIERHPLSLRIGNALISYATYLWQFVWPEKLAVLYPYRVELSLIPVLASGAVVFGITALAVGFLRRSPYVFTGWFWYLGTVFPVIGLIQIGAQSTADRYTYLPMIGPAVMLTWGLCDLTKRGRWQSHALSCAAGIVTLLCIATTRRQIDSWRTTETLFRHAVAVTGTNPVAHMLLGLALWDTGARSEAVVEVRRCIELAPNYGEARLRLGIMLDEAGDTLAAQTEIKVGVRLAPWSAEAHLALGNVLNRLGEPAQAIGHFQEAIRLRPAYAEAHSNLGVVLEKIGRPEDAVGCYREALRLDPWYAEAHLNLGNVFYKGEHIDEALLHFEQAIRSKPDWADAHNSIAGALFLKDRLDEAITEYREALRLKPDHAEAGSNLEAVLQIQGSRNKR